MTNQPSSFESVSSEQLSHVTGGGGIGDILGMVMGAVQGGGKQKEKDDQGQGKGGQAGAAEGQGQGGGGSKAGDIAGKVIPIIGKVASMFMGGGGLLG